MNHKILLLCAIFLYSPIYAFSDSQIRLCDRDITDTSHPFYWDNLKLTITNPDSEQDFKNVLTKTLYQQLFDQYQGHLTEPQKNLELVQKFIKLQQDILRDEASANLVVKRGIAATELSSGAKKIAVIPCQDSDKDYLISIAYLSIAYKKIHDEKWADLRSLVSRRIDSLDRQYALWFSNGLPMWPHENYINGKFLGVSDAEEPHNWQLVVARPSVGLGAKSSESLKNSQLQATLGIEPIGFVVYTSADYSKYWGLSFLMVGGDDVGFGYGLLARKDKYVLGVTRRANNPDYGVSKDDTYLFIGVDLYNVIHEKKERFSELKDKVDNQLNVKRQQLDGVLNKLSSSR